MTARKMPREPLEIRHLRYFLAVAQTQNFTRAAERLRITQPSISQGVAQLEAILGSALFRRAGKRVHLTEAGAALRSHAEAVIRKLEEARASVQQVTGLLTGHVELGVIPVLHGAWVPSVLALLARDYPGITVRVQQRSSSDIETELEAGRLDLGFGLMTRAVPTVRYERVVSEPFSLLVPAASAFRARAPISLRELHAERLVMLPNSFDMRRMAEALFRRHGVRPNVVFELDNIETVLRSVRRAGTPTILPAIALHGRERLGLQAIALREKGTNIEFGLLWPAGGAASPAAQALATTLKAALKREGDGRASPPRPAPRPGTAPR